MTPFEDLYKNAPVAYHELDSDGVIRRVNETECELLGYTAEELIGQPVWNFIAAEEVEEGRIAFQAKIKGGTVVLPRRRTYVTKQGQYLVAELRDKLIRNESGEVVGLRTALVDITERAREEANWAESLRWQREILQSIPHGIVAVDGLGVIAHINRAAETLTGWTLQEAKGEAFETVMQVAGLSVGPWCDVPLSGMFHRCLFEGWRGKAMLMSRDGVTTPVCVCSMPLGRGSNSVAGFVLVVSPLD